VKKKLILGIMLAFSLLVYAAEVDIYANYVIVRENWPAVIKPGEKVNLEWQLPENVDLSSFSILNDQIDVTSRYESKKDPLLGRLVTVWAQNGRTYSGLLKDKGSELMLVDPRTGQLAAVINNSQVVAIIPQEDAGSYNQMLKLELQNKGNQKIDDLKVRYRAEGISWAIKYSLQLNGTKAVLLGEYQIENNTTKPFEAALVRLIARKEPGPVLYAREASANLKGDAGGYGGYSLPNPNQQAETAVYEIPGEINIPAEAKIRLPLLKEENLTVKRRYILNYNNVEVEITLDGISQPLPSGEINIFDGDILATTQYLPNQPQSGQLLLNLGETLDIAGSREQLRHYSSGGKLFDEYQVTLKNNKKETVSVEVVAYLPWDNAEVLSDMPNRRISANKVVFEVKLKASEELSFNYTFRYVNK